MIRLKFFLLLVAFWVPLTSFGQTEPSPEADEGKLVEGIVLNPMGGGIKDAVVRIESPDASADDPPIATGTTDQFGNVAIRLPEVTDDSVRIRIHTENHEEYVADLDLSEPYPFFDATLRGAASLNGFVIDDHDDEPLAGVRVRCDNGGRTLWATSNEIGKFVFNSIYFGPATVTVMADGYGTERQQFQVDEQRIDINIALKPERPVHLNIVTNKGRPAREVFVEVIALPDHNYFSTWSDEQGKAMIHGLHADTTGIQVRMSGPFYVQSGGYSDPILFTDQFLSDSQSGSDGPPTTAPANQEYKLTITAAGIVKGRITDQETGRPIVGVRVTAGREQRYDMPVDFSGVLGKYELEGIRPGIVTLTYQHADYAPRIEEVDVFTGQTIERDVTLSKGRPIGGVVVDEQGEPVEEVRVSALSWRGFETISMRTITAEDGRFHFDNAPDGDIRFSFVKPGLGQPQEEMLQVGNQDHRILLENLEQPMPQSVTERGKIKTGEQVPDLQFTTTDGRSYQLSELRGKYIFLDCWASWCGPCIAELPNIRKLHEATRDRADFLLIGISLDSDRTAMTEAMETHDITWPQVFGPKSGAQELFDALDGVGIPYTCLIGPDGKILAQDLRGPGIVDQVRQLLPEEKQDPLNQDPEKQDPEKQNPEKQDHENQE